MSKEHASQNTPLLEMFLSTEHICIYLLLISVTNSWLEAIAFIALLVVCPLYSTEQNVNQPWQCPKKVIVSQVYNETYFSCLFSTQYDSHKYCISLEDGVALDLRPFSTKGEQ